MHDRGGSLPDAGPIPDALRPSSSLAKLSLYTAPYEKQTPAPRRSHVNEFGVTNGPNRRDSYPVRHSSLAYLILYILTLEFSRIKAH